MSNGMKIYLYSLLVYTGGALVDKIHFLFTLLLATLVGYLSIHLEWRNK